MNPFTALKKFSTLRSGRLTPRKRHGAHLKKLGEKQKPSGRISLKKRKSLAP
jgi:hypothetical protein